MVNIAIIGTGDISKKRHIPAILQSKYGKLYGFYNRNVERTKEQAVRYGVRAYESLEELWDDGNVEAVLIATPTGSHAELAIQALKAGKHVLLEKPMTSSVEEAEAIRDAACQTGKKVMLLHIQRFYEPHARAKELLDNGEIGRLLSIRSFLGNADDSLLEGEVHADWQDALYNVGIHRIDLMRWLVGSEVNGVLCYRSRLLVKPETDSKRPPDDHAIGILQYENGVVGTLIASCTSFHWEDRSTVLIGTEGTITTYTGKHGLVLEKRNGEKTWYDFPTDHPQYIWELTDTHDRFFRSIINDTEPPVTAEDGVASIKIAAALEEADRKMAFVSIH